MPAAASAGADGEPPPPVAVDESPPAASSPGLVSSFEVLSSVASGAVTELVGDAAELIAASPVGLRTRTPATPAIVAAVTAPVRMLFFMVILRG